MRNTLAGMAAYFDGFFDSLKHNEPTAEYQLGVQLAAEFGQYVDNLAIANPHRLHHVYEWYRVGEQTARLFDMRVVPVGSNVTITYEFLQSVTPNANGQIFANKAAMMESGQEVTFTTEKPVPIEDTFRVGSFTFTPGGNDTNGAFRETFLTYFSARNALKRSKIKAVLPESLTYANGYKDGRRIYDRIIG